MLFHNFVAFSLQHTWNELGFRCKNSDTAQYLVCPPLAAKTARQRRLMLQISFLMTCNWILTHSACKVCSRSRTLLTSWRSLTPDDLSGPISAHWGRDPVILQATATHWRYKFKKCTWYAWQCVDGHYHVGKSQRYVVANTVQQQAR